MGQRSTTIAFLIVMLACAVIWLIYKDKGAELQGEESPVVQGVVLGPGGTPVAGAEVMLRRQAPASPDAEPAGPLVYTVASDADGTFRFTNLPDGEYTLTIESKNMAPATVKGVSVTNQRGPDALTVQLEPAERGAPKGDPVEDAIEVIEPGT